MTKLPPLAGPPHVLLTSVGRRVSLLRAFEAAADARGASVYAADLDPTAPGLYVAAEAALVPRVTAPGYVERLLELVERWRVALIVPLIDPELPVLAAAQRRLNAAGALAMVPDLPAVQAGWDKLETARLFDNLGIPAPRTALWVPSMPPWDVPVVVKPRFGSNSANIARCQTWADVPFHAARTPAALIQEWLIGPEITVDVLCDFDGRLLDFVPRRRLKVRAGEVERAVTEWDAAAEAPIRRLIEHLRPAGVINLQYFRTADGPRFTEINPRFGGGYPLAQAAGANYPAKLLALRCGEVVTATTGQFARGLHMLRYDSEVFRSADALIEQDAPPGDGP